MINGVLRVARTMVGLIRVVDKKSLSFQLKGKTTFGEMRLPMIASKKKIDFGQ